MAIRQVGALLEGGWPAVRKRNRLLALEGRRRVCTQLQVEIPCPDTMLGSLAAIPLPNGLPQRETTGGSADPLQEALYSNYHIEIPISNWPEPPKRLLRLSAHLYNNSSQYDYLAEALQKLVRCKE